MRSKYTLIVLSVVAAMAAVAVVVSAGNPDNPPGPPETTSWYTLEHIYDRLTTGAAGTQITFTEPTEGPSTGTMYTLNEIMSVAPAVDDVDGAAPAEVAAGKTFWGLRSSAWATQTGTMANNGAVTIVPTTTNQMIAAGYHNGSGYVEGDLDLMAANIAQGVDLFGVVGTLTGGITYEAGVPKTGQTSCWDSNGNPISCSGSGQDGEYQMGVEWPIPRFTDNGDGTVTDNMTGLTWLKDATCMGEMHWGDNANETFDILSRLNGGEDFNCSDYTPGAFDDWRLPNVREMHSLIHYGFYDPAVPDTTGTGQWSEGDPFTGVNSHKYWTSTTRTGYHHHVWLVYLYIGDVEDADKFYTYYMWPVRGGQ
jgi:hypothetical protein